MKFSPLFIRPPFRILAVLAATGRVPSWAAGLMGDEIDERAAASEVRDD